MRRFGGSNPYWVKAPRRTLPIGLNRISWKRESFEGRFRDMLLPIGLNRISWKR